MFFINFTITTITIGVKYLILIELISDRSDIVMFISLDIFLESSGKPDFIHIPRDFLNDSKLEQSATPAYSPLLLSSTASIVSSLA